MFKKSLIICFAILMAVCFASCDSGGGGNSISGVPEVYKLVYSNVTGATSNVTDYNFGDDIFISFRVKDGDKDVNMIHFVIKKGSTVLLDDDVPTMGTMPAEDASINDFAYTLLLDTGALDITISVKDTAGHESNKLTFSINVH